MRCYIFLFVLLIVGFQLSAQITVINPSFEDAPADATTPQGWMPCEPLTTPDILPGFWGVYNEPSHGLTYVGIITRENGSFESFGQRTSQPLKKNNCYHGAIDLAHSTIYAGYTGEIRLRIYIGESACSKDQLIFESPVIKGKEWHTYPFKFRPQGDCQYIILEAFYKEGNFSHKGNILLDNLKPFRRCGNA